MMNEKQKNLCKVIKTFHEMYPKVEISNMERIDDRYCIHYQDEVLDGTLTIWKNVETMYPETVFFEGRK